MEEPFSEPFSEPEGGPVSETPDWEQTLKEPLPQDPISDLAFQDHASVPVSHYQVSELASGDHVAESPSDPAPIESPEAPSKPAPEPAVSRPATPTRLRWVEPSIPPHMMATRRTGVAFLSLIVTTNCIPWTQIAQSNPESQRLASFQESVMIVMTCFLAAALVLTAWFLGRRLPMDRGPRVANPRDSGLLLAVLAAGANLALAIIIRSAQFSGPKSLRLLGAVWLILILPTEIAAGFCKGRASIPFRRPAGAPVKSATPVPPRRSTRVASPLHK